MKMNKYQEALERVRLDLEDRIETDNILMVGRMDIVTLSEACKKAKKYDKKETAMKPNNFDKEYFMYNCPNCSKVNATFKFSYCPHCGQKLDWN